MSRISPPGAGWHVEITLPSGRIAKPDVVGDPSRNPAANDYPSLDIPVADRDLWHNLDLDQDIPMAVYFDGRPQPIDGLEDVSDSEGATVTLSGRGGTELETRDRRSVNYRAAHLVCEDIITAATSYQANVDRPATTVDENVTVQTADTEAEWEDRRATTSTFNPIEVADNDVSPLSIGDGEGLTLGKTAWVKEAENADIIQNAIPVSDSGASDGTVLEFKTDGDYAEITPPKDVYTIPTSEMRAAVRHRFPDDPDSDGDYETPEIEYYLAGTLQGGYADTASVTGSGWRWDIINPTDADVDGSIWPNLAVECISNPQGARMLVDVMVVYDARFHDGSSFDNSVDADGYLSSPTDYPIGATKSNYPDIEFRNAQTAEAVVGARAELTANDASAIEEIGLSNDRGESFATSGSDVTTFEHDFTDVGPSARLKLTLSGTDATRSTATPTQGFERPEIDSYTLKADLEDLPLVIDQAFDDSAMSNLQTVSETLADFLFEFRVARDGTESVEVTTPGQRTSDRSETVSAYESETTDVDRVERVVVKGTSRRTEDESFTADVSNWVDLDEDEIQLGRSIVREPGTNNRFTEGTDYDIDPTQGRIKALSAGNLTDGTTYEIDYSHRPSGQATLSSAGASPDTEIIDIPALASDRACAQTAQRILEQVDDPLQKATVTIPSDQAGWNIVDAISLDQLPSGFDNLEIREVTNTPDQTVLRLGSRQAISEVVGQVRQQVEAVSRRA